MIISPSKDFLRLPPRQSVIDAIIALTEFSDAMNDGITIHDLKAAFPLMIEEGHELLGIQLAMAQTALNLLKGE